MNETELERLVVSLEANTAKLDKAIAASGSLLDRQLRVMETRIDTFGARMTKSFALSSRRFNDILGSIGVGLSIGALEQFVSKAAEAAEGIKKQSEALGLTTDAYQTLSISAKHAGIDQEQFNVAIDKFSKNLGEAQLKSTDFGKLLKKLGVDTKGDVIDVFYRFIDALDRVGNAQQRTAVAATAFGKAGVPLVALAKEGSAALREQAAQFKANGEVIDSQAIEKIHELAIKWDDLKRQLTVAGIDVLGGFADKFHEFTTDMSGGGFQSALKNFGTILAEVAGSIVKMAPYLPTLGGVLAGYRIGGPLGAIGGGIVGAEVQNRDKLRAFGLEHAIIPGLQTDIAAARNGFRIGGPDADTLRRQLSAAQGELSLLKGRMSGSLETPQSQSGTNMDALLAIMGSGKAGKAGGGIDLSGALGHATPSAFDKAVRALKDRTAALTTQSGEFATYTEAQDKARVSTELLTAAQEDAAKHGGKVSAERLADIERLSGAYAKIAAASKFATDLGAEDDRIAKLKAEGTAAGYTAAQLATLTTREELLAKFRAVYGDKASPSASQLADINARAGAAGSGTASADFAKAIDEANKQVDALASKSGEIGVFGAALGEAQMKAQLLNRAIEAGQPLDKATLETIGALSRKYGELSQSIQDATKNYDDQVKVTDELRSGAERVTATAIHGFQNLRDVGHQVLDQMAEMILKLYVMEPLLKGILGPENTAGGGLLGNAVSWMFGGGSKTGNTADSAVKALTADGSLGKPLHVVVDGGLPGLGGGGSMPNFGGAASAGSSAASNGDFWSGIGSFFSSIFSGFARGGTVHGPGSNRSDSILARVSRGEKVMTFEANNRYGDILDAMNAGLPVFAAGGPVGRISAPRIPSVPKLSAMQPAVHVSMPVSIDARGAEIGVEEKIAAKLRDAYPVFMDAAARQFDHAFPGKLFDTLANQG